MRLALISDVHANRWALEAVLDDVDRRGVTALADLGDSLNGPLDPAGTLRVLNARFPSRMRVRGNGERTIYDLASASRSGAYSRQFLSDVEIEDLRALPLSLAWQTSLFFHATPNDDETYLLEDVSSGRPVLRDRPSIRRLLGDTADAHLVACGHTHIPRFLRLGRTAVVNPGSVGLPAYDDELPYPHVMETGSPNARYAILDLDDRGAVVWTELISIAYDVDAGATHAEGVGFSDWAYSIRTGLCAS